MNAPDAVPLAPSDEGAFAGRVAFLQGAKEKAASWEAAFILGQCILVHTTGLSGSGSLGCVSSGIGLVDHQGFGGQHAAGD